MKTCMYVYYVFPQSLQKKFRIGRHEFLNVLVIYVFRPFRKILEAKTYIIAYYYKSSKYTNIDKLRFLTYSRI